MQRIHLKKGYTLKLSGRPSDAVAHLLRPVRVAAVPQRMRWWKPHLRVKVGDRVQVGSILFEDKRRPELLFRSPGGGTVSAINFGPRRALGEIVIDIDSEESFVVLPRLSGGEVEGIKRTELIDRIIEGGFWPLIRELPFRDVARPDTVPPELFVNLDNLEPFHPQPEVYLLGRRELFSLGLRVLERIVGKSAIVTICQENGRCLKDLGGLPTHQIAGDYPAHDPGVLLYRIKTSPDQNHAWFIDGQDVLLLAEFLQTGRFPTERIVTLGGAAAARHVGTRIGIPLTAIAEGRDAADHSRYIVGGVLTGCSTPKESFLGLFEKSLVLLPEGNQPGPFLGCDDARL
jgi:Na+-transporting NADH:ubiquinone oxidoreductase subunit A